jgi:class 3 adenylate cyclase
VGEIRYAHQGELHVAYSVDGTGPPDVVFVSNWLTDVESMPDVPAIGEQLARMSTFARVAIFDQPGTGHSDPLMGEMPTLETFADTVGVVMDAVGIERAALVAWDLALPTAIMFAASHPERVSGLISIGGTARFIGDEGYPGLSPDQVDMVVDGLVANWGKRAYSVGLAPSIADDGEACDAIARWMRHALSPGMARRVFDMGIRLDTRALLPSVVCPVLLLYSSQPVLAANPLQSEYVAGSIPHAQVEIFDTSDHLPVQRDHFEWMMGLIQEFVTGHRPAPETEDRVLASVLFTDLVSSTETAARLGDHEWRRKLDALERQGVAEVDRHKGKLIKTTGDGILATFDGPARAIRCALALGDVARRQGVHIRAGVHTGEVELRGEDIGGIAVHIAARVMAKADADEVLTSSMVKDLVVGSGITFEDRGSHALKGVPDEWRIYAVDG